MALAINELNPTAVLSSPVLVDLLSAPIPKAVLLEFVVPLPTPFPTVNPLTVISPVTVKPVKFPTDVRDEFTTELFKVVPDKVPASAVTVIFAEPSNATSLMVFVSANLVAVLALPDSGPENPVAVIVPALKSPLASRATIALAVLLLVAVVAELLTLRAVTMVPNLLSAIAAVEEMSSLTIAPSAILALVMAPVAMDGEAAEPLRSPAN